MIFLILFCIVVVCVGTPCYVDPQLGKDIPGCGLVQGNLACKSINQTEKLCAWGNRMKQWTSVLLATGTYSTPWDCMWRVNSSVTVAPVASGAKVAIDCPAGSEWNVRLPQKTGVRTSTAPFTFSAVTLRGLSLGFFDYSSSSYRANGDQLGFAFQDVTGTALSVTVYGNLTVTRSSFTLCRLGRMTGQQPAPARVLVEHSHLVNSRLAFNMVDKKETDRQVMINNVTWSAGGSGDLVGELMSGSIIDTSVTLSSVTVVGQAAVEFGVISVLMLPFSKGSQVIMKDLVLHFSQQGQNLGAVFKFGGGSDNSPTVNEVNLDRVSCSGAVGTFIDAFGIYVDLNMVSLASHNGAAVATNFLAAGRADPKPPLSITNMMVSGARGTRSLFQITDATPSSTYTFKNVTVAKTKLTDSSLANILQADSHFLLMKFSQCVFLDNVFETNTMFTVEYGGILSLDRCSFKNNSFIGSIFNSESNSLVVSDSLFEGNSFKMPGSGDKCEQSAGFICFLDGRVKILGKTKFLPAPSAPELPVLVYYDKTDPTTNCTITVDPTVSFVHSTQTDCCECT